MDLLNVAIQEDNEVKGFCFEEEPHQNYPFRWWRYTIQPKREGIRNKAEVVKTLGKATRIKSNPSKCFSIHSISGTGMAQYLIKSLPNLLQLTLDKWLDPRSIILWICPSHNTVIVKNIVSKKYCQRNYWRRKHCHPWKHFFFFFFFFLTDLLCMQFALQLHTNALFFIISLYLQLIPFIPF